MMRQTDLQKLPLGWNEMIKKIFCLLIFTAVFCCVEIAVSAEESNSGFLLSVSAEEGEPESSVRLTLEYSGDYDSFKKMMIDLEYDTDTFSFKRFSSKLNSTGLLSVTLPGDGWVGSCCLRTDDRSDMPQGTLIVYYFDVASDADLGESTFEITVTGDISAEIKAPFVVVPPPDDNAALSALIPSVGELSPVFSPDCFEYNVSVPSSVDLLTFTAESAEGAACKINRKTLEKAGKDTKFNLTVTAADGKTKQIYTVTVHRAAVTPSPSPAASAGTTLAKTPTPKPTPAPTAELTPTNIPTATPTVTPNILTSLAPNPTAAPTSQPTQIQQIASSGEEYMPTAAIRGLGVNVLPAAVALLILVAAIGISKPMAHCLYELLLQTHKSKNQKKK